MARVTLTLRGLNLTSRKIMYFTSRRVNSQNFGLKTGFKPIFKPRNIYVSYFLGLVRLYDSDRKSRRLGTTTLPPLLSSAVTPRYAPSNYDVCTHRKAMDMQHEKTTYNPWKSAAF